MKVFGIMGYDLLIIIRLRFNVVFDISGFFISVSLLRWIGEVKKICDYFYLLFFDFCVIFYSLWDSYSFVIIMVFYILIYEIILFKF